MVTIYLFALVGTLLVFKKNKNVVFLFISIIIYFSALTGVVGITRYRIPFIPFIEILSSVGIAYFYTFIKKSLNLKKI